MKKFNKKQFISVIYIFQLIIALLVVSNPSMVKAADGVSLYSATSFGILAGSTITNTGTTNVNGTAGGDIGLHPGEDQTIETFPGQESVILSGDVYMFEEVAQQAKSDLYAAYNDAADRDSTKTIAADLDGLTLSPGVYTSASSISLTGTLYLDGGDDPNAVFIFQAGSTLTTMSDSEIILLNGAQPCNVFWQVGSSAILGTDSTFVGHILALQSITAATDAVIYGSLLAINGAVTLDSNTIINDACTVLGSLIVTKDVVGPIGDMILPNFEVTITGPNNYVDTQLIASGGEYIWDGLVSGNYILSEKFISDEWEASGLGTYAVADDAITKVTVTNTYTPTVTDSNGTLTVTKVVVGNVEGLTLSGFDITITGPNNYSDTQTLASGEKFTWSGLASGTYRVSEALINEYWAVKGVGQYAVVDNEITDVTITNTYSTTGIVSYGALKVTKVVLGNVDGVTLPDFVITISGPNNYSDTRKIESDGSYTWINLIPGEYKISESRDGLSSYWEVIGESTVQVLAGQTITSTITNEYMGVGGIKILDMSDNSDRFIYSGLILLGLGLFILRKFK